MTSYGKSGPPLNYPISPTLCRKPRSRLTGDSHSGWIYPLDRESGRNGAAPVKAEGRHCGSSNGDSHEAAPAATLRVLKTGAEAVCAHISPVPVGAHCTDLTAEQQCLSADPFSSFLGVERTAQSPMSNARIVIHR